MPMFGLQEHQGRNSLLTDRIREFHRCVVFELDLKKINEFHCVKRRRGISVQRNSLNECIAVYFICKIFIYFGCTRS